MKLLRRPIITAILIIALILFLAYLITPEMDAMYEKSSGRPEQIDQTIRTCLNAARTPPDCF